MQIPASHHCRKQRKGLSLLEVILSVAIFLLALGGLSHLMSVATENAQHVQAQSQLARLCQSKLAEVVAGAVPLEPQSNVAFEEDPNYQWSIEAEQGDVTGLWNVTIRVSPVQGVNPASSQARECVLHQMVLDPSLVGSTLDAATIAGADQTGVTDDTTTQSGSATTGQ